MRMFPQDQREIITEVEDTIHPQPEPPKRFTVAELVDRLQQSDINPDWLVTIVMDGSRSSIKEVDTDYHGAGTVVELWAN